MHNYPNVIVYEGIRLHVIQKVAHSSFNLMFKELEFKRTKVKDEGEEGEIRIMAVRHPLDRMVSAWAFFCKRERQLETTLYKLGYKDGMSFEDFYKVCLEAHELNIHTAKQVHFTGGWDIDILLPMEHLDEDWENLRKRFPTLPKMIRHNPSNHEEWREYYNDEMRFEAERIFSKDLELYNKALKQRSELR